jgi:hypothetical protein
MQDSASEAAYRIEGINKERELTMNKRINHRISNMYKTN